MLKPTAPKKPEQKVSYLKIENGGRIIVPKNVTNVVINVSIDKYDGYVEEIRLDLYDDNNKLQFINNIDYEIELVKYNKEYKRYQKELEKYNLYNKKKEKEEYTKFLKLKKKFDKE